MRSDLENGRQYVFSDDEARVLLTEYANAQKSAEHHDNLIWRNTSIIGAGNLILLGLVFNNLDKDSLRWVIECICGLGILIDMSLWRAVFIWNDVMGQKYQRCQQIESRLGMLQHRGLSYEKNRQKIVYSGVMLSLAFLWTAILIHSIYPVIRGLLPLRHLLYTGP